MSKILKIGLLIGFLLNLTGWIGNNLILGGLWQEVNETITPVAWHQSIWKEVFSLLPDFLYGIAIAWLCVVLVPYLQSQKKAALYAGLFVAMVGGITTYFAVANSGFIPWKLALASFALVLATKIPLALLAGRLLNKSKNT